MNQLIKNNNIYQSVIEIQRKGENAAIITVIETKGSTPREVGAKMIVLSNGSIINTIGGGAVEKLVIEDALKVIKSRKPVTVAYDLEGNSKGKSTGMICGGSMKFFIENIQTGPFLYIFGAGHVGREMYRLGLLYHFNIIMIDNRKEYLKAENFSKAFKLYHIRYPESIKMIQFIDPAYIVIMTQSHDLDEKAVTECLKVVPKYKYLGMIASQKKSNEVKKRLKQKKISEKKIQSLYSPAGLAIGSKTPEEIALSIMAEIVKVKNESNK
ncbi:MAG: XdhC/CoxI family protein [Spirochaetes bacterium]|nr:XdhC/CoxI family protein [Spirochaetota bacterium]